MNKEHTINQCTNDWITCKCGKLFGDSIEWKESKLESSAKTKFLNHLKDENVDPWIILELEENIQRKERKELMVKRNSHKQ